MAGLKEAILNYFTSFENSLKHFIDDESVLKSFEALNLNDDYVIYCSVYILFAIFLFIVCTLTNFYRIKTKEVIYVTRKLDEKHELKK